MICLSHESNFFKVAVSAQIHPPLKQVFAIFVYGELILQKSLAPHVRRVNARRPDCPESCEYEEYKTSFHTVD